MQHMNETKDKCPDESTGWAVVASHLPAAAGMQNKGDGPKHTLHVFTVAVFRQHGI